MSPKKMSPTKISPAKTCSTFSRRAVVAAAASTRVSAIPRRVKNPATKSRQPAPKKPAPSARTPIEPESILKDSTATTSNPRPVSYFSRQNKTEKDKENMPMTSLGRPTYRVVNGGSPTRGKTGVTKFHKSSISSSLKKRVLNRVPLRELDGQEIFERDEAVLGDLRRRRSGEHSHVEFDSTLAGPSDAATRGTSIVPTNSRPPTASTSTSTAIQEGSSGRLLIRSDAELALRKKIDAIIASTSARASNGVVRTLKRLSPTKTQHPAIRISSPEPTSPITPVRQNASFSPLHIRRSPSPIFKCSPSPIRPAPTTVRTGLAIKSTNTLLKDKKLVIGGENAEPSKKVIRGNGTAANGKFLKKKPMTQKPGNSLRRAAGAMAPAKSLLTNMAGKTEGLEGIRKLR